MPGVLVRLDDKGVAAAPARRARNTPRERRGQQRADERARVAARLGQEMHEPARRRRLAVRAAHADQPAPVGQRGISDELLPRLDRDRDAARRFELGMVGRDRRERFGDRDTIDQRSTSARGNVIRVVAGPDVDADGLELGRVGRRSCRVARRDDGPGSCGEVCGRRRARARCADDVDPFASLNSAGGSCGCQSLADLLCGARHARLDARAVACSSRSCSAAAALKRLLPSRSEVQWKRRTSVPAADVAAT